MEYGFGTMNIETIQNERNFQKWWNLTGNGDISADVTANDRTAAYDIFTKLQSFFKPLKDDPKLAEVALKNTEEYMADLAKSQTAEGKNDAELMKRVSNNSKIGIYTDTRSISIRVASGNYDYLNLESCFRPDIYPEVYAEFMSEAVAVGKNLTAYLSEEFNRDPFGTSKRIMDAFTNSNLQATVNLSRVIVIFTANDQFFLEDVKVTNRKDPDEYREKYSQRWQTDGKNYLKKFLYGIFGKPQQEDAFLNRQGRIGYILPPSSEQCKQTVRNLVNDAKFIYESELRAKNINVTINIEQSILDYFYEVGVNPFDGPRFLIRDINTALTQLHINANQEISLRTGNSILSGLTDASTAEVPDRLVYSFDRVSRNFVAAGYRVDKQVLGFNVPAAIQTQENSATSASPVVIRKQQAVRMAGQMIIGSLLFGSLPNLTELSQGDIQFANSLDFWMKPELEQLGFKRDQLIVLLSGLIAEELFMPGAMPSTRSAEDVQVAKGLLEEIEKSIYKLKELNALNPERISHVDLSEILPKEILSLGVINEIKNNDQAGALLTAQRFIREILKRNNQTMAQLQAAMINNPSINNELIGSILKSELRKTEGRTVFQRLKTTSYGVIASDPCRLLVVRSGLFSRMLHSISGALRVAVKRSSPTN